MIVALRRPATADDAFPEIRRPDTGAVVPITSSPLFTGLGDVYIDFVRALTSVDGHHFWVIASRPNEPYAPPLSNACLAALRAELVKRSRHAAPQVRAYAFKSLGLRRRQIQRTLPTGQTPEDRLTLFEVGAAGFHSAGISSVSWFRTHAGYGTTGSRGEDAVMTGLVPDGVASVKLYFPRVIDRGKDLKPTVFPSAVTVTAPIKDNVLDVKIPGRDVFDAIPARTTWLDATGKVMRVIDAP